MYLLLTDAKLVTYLGNILPKQWTGSRVVDYVLSESSQLDKITDFRVGAFRPWLSDHCPLHYNLSLKRKLKPLQRTHSVNYEDIPDKYVWDHSSTAKFEEYLSSEVPGVLFENIMTDPENINPAKFAEMITNGILKRVTDSGIKTKKKHKHDKPNKNNNATWFDGECQKLKSKVAKLATKLKNSPESNDLRENLFIAKREFRNLVKKKKISYKYSIIE